MEKIVAIRTDKKQAIILAMNTSIAGDVKWGRLYLVKEKKAGEYPIVVREVSHLPDNKDWRII